MSPAPAIKPEPRDPSDAIIVRPTPLTEVVSPSRRAQDEALLAFDAEEAKERPLESSPPRARRTRLILALTLTIVAAVALAGVASYPGVVAGAMGPSAGRGSHDGTGKRIRGFNADRFSARQQR